MGRTLWFEIPFDGFDLDLPSRDESRTKKTMQQVRSINTVSNLERISSFLHQEQECKTSEGWYTYESQVNNEEVPTVL